ncbi:MAG: hypothetical protein VKI82_06555 [Leptolyngbya sp.]|nr:hypothetical protein [Leptolyngbya sp.]
MNAQNLKASHFFFSSAIWVLLLVGLWRMGFSLADVIGFGRQMSDHTRVTDIQELVQYSDALSN